MTYEQAMDAIRDEMASAGGAVAQVGEIATELLRRNPDRAEAVAGKSLAGALDKMRKAAEKRRGRETCVCVGPEEATAIIAAYYGFKVEAAEAATGTGETGGPAADDGLDALMEGLI